MPFGLEVDSVVQLHHGNRIMFARNLSIAFTICCTLLSVILLDLGLSWIFDGHGLNPGLSLPLAGTFVILPFFVAPLILEFFGEEDTTIAVDLRTEDEKDDDRVVALINGRPMTAKQFYRQHAID